MLATSMPWADSRTTCARRHVTTDHELRRTIRSSRLPSSLMISRTRTRSTAVLPGEDKELTNRDWRPTNLSSRIPPGVSPHEANVASRGTSPRHRGRKGVSQLSRMRAFQATHAAEATEAIKQLKKAAINGDNVFAVLMEAARVCSLQQTPKRSSRSAGSTGGTCVPIGKGVNRAAARPTPRPDGGRGPTALCSAIDPK